MKISIVFRNKDETKPLWFEKMKEKISNYVTRQRRKTPVCSCRDVRDGTLSALSAHVKMK